MLVTGGLGFIGSHLVEELLKKNHEVSIIDNLSSNVLQKDHYGSDAEIHIGNISDILFIERICSQRKFDYIFHFAANVSVSESVENDTLNFSSNVLGTYNVLKSAIKMKSDLILASTCTVYGSQNEMQVSENSPTNPISPYGLSKLIDEQMCTSYARIYDINTVALRFFNVYGSRQQRSVFYDFLKKYSQSEDGIKMLGTGNEIKDFINIKDVLKAIMLPLKNEKMWGDVFNVGTGKGTRIKDLLYLILTEMNKQRDILFSGHSWRGDVREVYANIDKIKRYGFRPEIDLISGIQELIGRTIKQTADIS